MDPAALEKAVEKFTARFTLVENEVRSMGKEMNELSLEELDSIWDRVKHE